SHFTDESSVSVKFSGYYASSVNVLSDSAIQAMAPSFGTSTGPVDVTVSNQAGTSATSSDDLFTYLSASPTVTGLSVTSGLQTGGTVVAIHGTHFNVGGTVAVSFGGYSTSATVDSDTQITATSPYPAGLTGPVHVIVTTSFGQADESSADLFTYTSARPTVTQ